MSNNKIDFFEKIKKLNVVKEDIEWSTEWYIDVTPILKIIFGKGIIKKAYIQVEGFNQDEANNVMKQLVRYFNDTGRLDYDDNDLYVIFKNDNVVKFHSSEWSAISQIKGA